MDEQLITECIGVIEDYTNIVLTVEQFRSLMDDNPKLQKTLIKYKSPRDTMDREMLMQAVAVKCTGKDWPTYGDQVDAKEFAKSLEEGAIKVGYSIR
jgi:hypothetical protein